MKHVFCLMFLLALLARGLPAVAEVKIEGEARVPNNSFVALKATGDTKDAEFVWHVNGDTTRVVTVNDQVFFNGPPGTYRVYLTSVRFAEKKIDRAELVVTITGPAPPVPPIDQLIKATKEAFDAETDPAKLAQVKALASVYRAATDPVLLGKAPTWGALFTAMDASAAAVGVKGKLSRVQDVVQAELRAALPWKGEANRALDAAGRDQAIQAFTRIASVLEGLK